MKPNRTKSVNAIYLKQEKKNNRKKWQNNVDEKNEK